MYNKLNNTATLWIFFRVDIGKKLNISSVLTINVFDDNALFQSFTKFVALLKKFYYNSIS